MKLMSKVSKNIKKQRALNGMTQEELAAKIHVTRQTVSSWETDRTQPDLTVLQSLAEVFGTEVEELIYGKRKNAAEEKEKQLFGNTLVTVLSILGCLLIGAGAVLIFVKLWRSFPDALKIGTCFIPALAGQSFGIYTYIKKKESLPWREGASVLWLLGVIVTVTVLLGSAGLNFRVVSDSWMFTFFAVSALALMLIFRTLSPLAVVYVCSIVSTVITFDDLRIYNVDKGSSLDVISTFIFVVLVQAAITGAAFYISGALFKKENNIIRHSFSSWINFAGLTAFIFLALERTVLEEATVSLLILASVICFIIGHRHTDFVSPYRVLGLPATAAALCFLGIIFSLGHDSQAWADILVLVLGLIPFIFILWKKTAPKNIYLRVYAALLTAALTVYNFISALDDILSALKYAGEKNEMLKMAEKGLLHLSFVICLAALVMLIIYGAKERKLLHLNLGFIVSCVTVIARLYLLDLGLIATGILLIVCGAVLLFINLKISRLREKEQLAALYEGEEELQ